jgi:hypothetical protein
VCEPRPGARCATDTRSVAERTLTIYADAIPDGPCVLPLSATPLYRVCETSAELRLATDGSGSVSVESLEYLGDDDFWIPGPELSAEESSDLGAWLSDPRAYKSGHTRRTHRWDPVWSNGELEVTVRGADFTATASDGERTRTLAIFGERDALRMSAWIDREPASDHAQLREAV